jgi:hypothetical protein
MYDGHGQGFGYGNGGLEIAKLLEFNKVNYLVALQMRE